MATLGRATNDGSTDSYPANLAMGRKVTATENGLVTALSSYCGTSTAKARMFLYTDSAGVPGTKIVGGSEQTTASGINNWVVSASIVNGTVYWIIHIADGDPAMKMRTGQPSNTNQYKTSASYSTLSDPNLTSWPANTNTNEYDIFLTYTPTVGVPGGMALLGVGNG